jgi:hypothetical protein
MKCLYGRQECMFLKKKKCPRENECLFAGELKTKMKQKMKKGGVEIKDADSGEIRRQGTDQEGMGICNESG